MALLDTKPYEELNEKFGDDMTYMLGYTLLTHPGDADAGRLNMFTPELKQSLTLLDIPGTDIHPDVPRVSTGFENVFGRKNRSYKRLEGEWEVKAVIPKFDFIPKEDTVYVVVFYNKEQDLYDMIEKPYAECLGEKFGLTYNCGSMDNLEEGQIINDEVIYRSTSYDANMNYRYGKNAKTALSTSTDTIEDALKIRMGWAESVKTSEVDTMTITLNRNHLLLNEYGDDERYIPLPEIGQKVVNGKVCTLRVINKEHIFVDLQTKATQEANSMDKEYTVQDCDYCVIYDMDIRYNGNGPFPDNMVMAQLKKYYDSECRYADAVTAWATLIKDSGSKYTHNITKLKSDYQYFNNPEYRWETKDKKHFEYIQIEVKLHSVISLNGGSKLAGRLGDKGVISKIVDDEGSYDKKWNPTIDSMLDMLGRDINEIERKKLASEIEIVPDDKMPYCDEFPIDIIANSSGAIRRLNTGQIYEIELSFCAERIREYICTLDNDDAKMEVIFDFLHLVNQDQCEFFYDYYQNFSKTYIIKNHNIRFINEKGKRDFVKDIEENGIYIIKPPFANVRYETMKHVYAAFPFIQPYQTYINIFGRTHVPIMKRLVIGDKYMMVLKHNSNKNFSARSTFRLDRTNRPTKDTTKRDNLSSYSRNPVRIGEAYNLFSSIDPSVLAEYNIFMRSSILGRKALGKILSLSRNPLKVGRIKIEDSFINTNADIINAKLKTIGLELEFGSDEGLTEVVEDVTMPLHIFEYTIYDSPLNKEKYVKLFTLFKRYLENYTIVQTYPGEKEDVAWGYVFGLDEVKALDISDDVKEMLVSTSKVKNFESVTGIEEEKE